MDKLRAKLPFTVEGPLCISSLKSFEPVFYLGNVHASEKQFLAIGSMRELRSDGNDSFQKLNDFRNEVNDWSFGWCNYDLKNELEALSSINPAHFNNTDMIFVQPTIVFEIENNQVLAHYHAQISSENEVKKIAEKLWPKTSEKKLPVGAKVQFVPSLSKAEYLERVTKIKKHIQRGDIYEANFCQTFTANHKIDPYHTYAKLSQKSPTPHSAFVKSDNRYVLCASPERFVKKEANKITTEPIKGTAPRGKSKIEDEAIKKQLASSTKDKTENIMIVDLARNDLSKVALKGTVNVEELCKLYSFPQVHQLISKVSCRIPQHSNGVEVLQELFPIASMTGVPKISALEIIEEQEDFKRELYSGCIGYFTPDNDFDFNVVIRSLFYDAANEKLSYSVGGAIIDDSDPESEYEETLVKAKAIQSILS